MKHIKYIISVSLFILGTLLILKISAEKEMVWLGLGILFCFIGVTGILDEKIDMNESLAEVKKQ